MATGKLTALAIDRAHREGQPVMLCDGGGLYFRKQTRDGAAWTLRYRFAGRARWMTLVLLEIERGERKVTPLRRQSSR
jgi:hypothetical protein